LKRVRVLSFGSVPPEWGGLLRGGVATFHATLVEAIEADPELPVELVGIVTTGSGEGRAPVPLRIPAQGQQREPFLRSVLDELRPDVAVLNHFSTAYGLALPAVAPELPLVGIAHSWHSITQSDQPAVAGERMQRTMDALSALVVPSEFALEEGRRLGLRYPAAIHVIRYPLPHLFAERIDLRQQRSGVVFAGELVGRKNGAALIAAATRIGDMTVTLAGEGDQLATLEALAAELGVADRVRLTGSLAPDAIRRAMAGAEAFCLPSLSESFGIVYIEALACGTPVVGFPTVAEISRACGMEVGIALAHPTVEATAAAIDAVRSATWDRQALRRAVIDAYSPAEVAVRYARVLGNASP
jgi:glycosyltransferase involved in cell wall biosynthesis